MTGKKKGFFAKEIEILTSRDEKEELSRAGEKIKELEEKLAQRNPENLYQSIIKPKKTEKPVRPLPSSKMVRDWMQQVKELPRKVYY